MGIELSALLEGTWIQCVDKAGQVDAVVPIGLEIGDLPVGDSLLDPLHEALVCRVAEVGEVRHHAEFVNVGIPQIFRLHELHNVELLFGELHRQSAVLQAFGRVQGCVVGTETWADAINESAESYSGVPVGGEVPDVLVWDLGVDPGQHGVLGGEGFSRAADLITLDQGPDQT